VLFEGAQGVLLDEWRGFHPHTTWSSTTGDAVETAAAYLGVDESIEHYGVIRAYLTRHGAGPFPTHDELLDEFLHEPQNSGHGWQGAFRRGHPDAVLLRYGAAVAGRLSGLLVSHLDVFDGRVALKWCRGYNVEKPATQERSLLSELPLGAFKDLDHQSLLTGLLQRARPEYDSTPILSADEFIERVRAATNTPVVLKSYGPRADDMK
jgi:adenylosuccinate synthase